MSRPTASTRLLALLGDPVAHSLSPLFQNAALRTAGLDGVYVALRSSAGALPGLLRGIARAGGGGNVTVPHKQASLELLDRTTEAVERTGACNTFWLEDGRVCGDNTDVAGFGAAARALAGDLHGARVLLLGAGGAARAALAALLDARADQVDLRNRTIERARRLQRALDPEGRQSRVLSGTASLASESYDLVVNATSLGLQPTDPLPLDLSRIGGAGAALDLVYGVRETVWVRHARAHGVSAADGTEMLLHQGAAAFERWWDRPAPMGAMRRALEGRE